MLDQIRYVLCDVDGVLTDGAIVVDDLGVETKAFHVLDGSAVVNLRLCGVATGLITGRQSRAVWRWAHPLGIREIHQGVKDKLAAARQIAQRHDLALTQIAYVGDDLLDLRLLQAAGYSACPADARAEVRAIADYVSPVAGGRGVLRDVAEHVLKAQGHWDRLLRERYGFEPPRHV